MPDSTPEPTTWFARLRGIGYSMKCCELCLHSRFYDPKSPWGLCTKYGSNEEPLKVHKLGRCRRGFKRDSDMAIRRGASGMMEFLG